jgi:transcriptional regulator with XRE-family HTH domain
MVSQEDRGAIDKLVGSRIRLRRLSLGISAEKFASTLKVPVDKLQRFEDGEERLNSTQLFRVSTLLGVEPEFFFSSEEGTGSPALSAPEEEISDKEFIRRFLELEPAGKKKLKEFLVSFGDQAS